MIACLPDDSMTKHPCDPACQACGQTMVVAERIPHLDRGGRSWASTCSCVIERPPLPDYGFRNEEVSAFQRLLVAREFGGAVSDALARHLLNSLAHSGTKVVLHTLSPGEEVVVTAEEAATLLGRELRSSAPGETIE